MANHNLPVITSTYANYTAELKGRMDDALLMLDPATSSPTDVPTNAIRFSSAAAKWQKWNGSSWVDPVVSYSININGNSATASAWSTPRTVTIGNTARVVDGSASVTWSLAEIGAQASLGFTPIQQGGGAGQLNNKVYVGWLANGTLGLQVDGSNFGAVWPINVSGNAATANNAATATALQTPRTINGVSFNGTANIVVNPPAGSVGTLQLVDGAATGTKLGADVVKTSGYQSIGGIKRFEDSIVIGGFYDIKTAPNGGFSVAASISLTGSYNFAFGKDALSGGSGTGSENSAFGRLAGFLNTSGNFNTAIGSEALEVNETGSYNTAVGNLAHTTSSSLSNAACFGYNAQVTGSNQVQLGNSATTTYVYGTVQNRSDLRDKADVRDTVLGLDFINALRPVDYKWDMREDYRPERPAELAEDATEEQKAAHKQAVVEWLEASRHVNLVRDGTKKRSRYHHGLIAQEVKAVLDAKGVDFGGFQDHSVNGGDDVLSIGYDELIAPLIRAVQQLSERVEFLESQTLTNG